MPNNDNRISRGSRVSAKIGPFEARPPPDDSVPTLPQRRPRNTRSTFQGTVVGSGQNDSHWRVYWDACNKTSEHTSHHLRWVSNPGISDEQSATMEALLRQMDIYIGTHKDMLDYTRTAG